MRLVGFSVENLRSVRERVVLDGLSGWDVLHGENNTGKSNLLLGLRVALDLLDRVWPADVAEQDDLASDADTIAPGVANLSRSDLPSRLVPHWDREAEPILLGLKFAEDRNLEDPVVVQFRIGPAQPTWRVEGRWLRQDDFEIRADAPSGERPPVPRPAVRVVDSTRTSPPGASTWDEWLLTRVDDDHDGGPWLAAQRRLEGALARLVPSFTGGRLDRHIRPAEVYPADSYPRQRRRNQEMRQELVWRTQDDRRLRFDDQGSGVRAIKDLLVAAAAGEGICLIEEPELHLSEALQAKLRRTLEELARPRPGLPPLQLILASHTAMFDHEGAWRVTLQDRATHIAPRARRAAPRSAADPIEAWVVDGANNAGYASASGVVLLPPSVQEQWVLPALLRFIPAENGGFFVDRVEDLRGEADEP